MVHNTHQGLREMAPSGANKDVESRLGVFQFQLLKVVAVIHGSTWILSRSRRVVRENDTDVVSDCQELQRFNDFIDACRRRVARNWAGGYDNGES